MWKKKMFGIVMKHRSLSFGEGEGGRGLMILIPAFVPWLSFCCLRIIQWMIRTLVRSVILFDFILNRKVAKDPLRTQRLCDLNF